MLQKYSPDEMKENAAQIIEFSNKVKEMYDNWCCGICGMKIPYSSGRVTCESCDERMEKEYSENQK
jgi:hypothetical protein